MSLFRPHLERQRCQKSRLAFEIYQSSPYPWDHGTRIRSQRVNWLFRQALRLEADHSGRPMNLV